MNELEDALSELADIRAHLAASTPFRGFAPETLLLAAVLSAGVALGQARWPSMFAGSDVVYVAFWGTLLAGIAVAGCELPAC